MIRAWKRKTLTASVILVLALATIAFAAWRESATIRKLEVKSIGSLAPHQGILMEDATRHKTVSVSFTSGTGFVIPPTDTDSEYQGAVWEIDASTVADSSIGTCDIVNYAPGDVAAVTVYVTAPTEGTHGMVHKIRKVDSGTTKLFLMYAGALPINTASGTTFESAQDAQGDYVELENNYNGAVSGYINAQRNT